MKITRRPGRDLSFGVRAAVVAGLALATGLAGCSAEQRRKREITGKWLAQDARPAKVHLPDGHCLDLAALPAPWRIAASTSDSIAEFGIPGPQSSPYRPPYSLFVSIGDPGDGRRDDRIYAEAWAEAGAPKPSRHDPARDVPGFDGYPADDGETVFVGDDLDALMECGVEYGCSLHDGVRARSTRLSISFPWQDRSAASERLQATRRLIVSLRTTCP